MVVVVCVRVAVRVTVRLVLGHRGTFRVCVSIMVSVT